MHTWCFGRIGVLISVLKTKNLASSCPALLALQRVDFFCPVGSRFQRSVYTNWRIAKRRCQSVLGSLVSVHIIWVSCQSLYDAGMILRNQALVSLFLSSLLVFGFFVRGFIRRHPVWLAISSWMFFSLSLLPSGALFSLLYLHASQLLRSRAVNILGKEYTQLNSLINCPSPLPALYLPYISREGLH